MAIGLKEGRRMAARARRWTLVKRVMLLVALLAIAVFAYETGATRTQYRIERLEERLAAQDAAIARLEAEKEELDRRRLAAVQNEMTLQARYDRNVPTGKRKEVFELLLERIDAGLEEERITFLLREAEAEPDCDPEPVTKRFVLATPLHDGANASAQFAEGTITVTGEGQAELTEAGLPEAWFDPAAPVMLRFTAIGGDATEARGKLPLDHSLRLAGDEYRFAARAGPRSFVHITALRCDFPG
ncbi:MAG: hypothetical protein OXG99_05000 [Alphaproteobacteria bacterium]|nr:hypothetical protein [Alphaproteobacteria bacterium]